MNGIVISGSPIIGHLGPVTLRWYSVFFALAVVVGVWLAVREGRRKDFSGDQIQALALWSVSGGLVGARLFHVVDRWDLYAANPIRVFYLSEGGLAVYGGLLGGVLVGVVYAWSHQLRPWKLAATSGGSPAFRTEMRMAPLPTFRGRLSIRTLSRSYQSICLVCSHTRTPCLSCYVIFSSLRRCGGFGRFSGRTGLCSSRPRYSTPSAVFC